MESRSLEMNWLQIRNTDKGSLPDHYTGIVDTWGLRSNWDDVYSYERNWYIFGKLRKSRTKNGVHRYYLYHDYVGSFIISPDFDKLFESLPAEEQDVIIWNFNLWR